MIQILVIDDDFAVRMLLERILKHHGYQVTTAKDGKTGLEQAIALQPDLIICDWMMPEINGIELCKTIKAQPQLGTTFFILLTALGSIEDKVIGLDAGADDFLCKPIEISELQARVRAGLRIQQLTKELQTQKHALEAELNEAAHYVQSMLPPPLQRASISIDTAFIPSSKLGGDGFDYFWLDYNRIAFYLLDVSGHGLKAALPSIALINLLRSRNGSQNINYGKPAEVLTYLNTNCQFIEQQGQYFTMWYGIYDLEDRVVTYASAGHPPAVLVSENLRDPPQFLKTQGFPVGMLPPEDVKYEEKSQYLPFGSKLYLFSDGIYENSQAQDHQQQWQLFLQFLQQFQEYDLGILIKTVCDRLHHNHMEDDLSIMKLRF